MVTHHNEYWYEVLTQEEYSRAMTENIYDCFVSVKLPENESDFRTVYFVMKNIEDKTKIDKYIREIMRENFSSAPGDNHIEIKFRK